MKFFTQKARPIINIEGNPADVLPRLNIETEFEADDVKYMSLKEALELEKQEKEQDGSTNC